MLLSFAQKCESQAGAIQSLNELPAIVTGQPGYFAFPANCSVEKGAASLRAGHKQPWHNELAFAAVDLNLFNLIGQFIQFIINV